MNFCFRHRLRKFIQLFNLNEDVFYIVVNKEINMSTIKSGDRCADCSHCKVWSSDHKKASCTLYTSDQGFHPDRPVPSKCVNKVQKCY